METNQRGIGYQVISKLLRLFFQLLYHEFAWSYDLVAAVVSLGRWNSWILSVLPFLEKRSVLELGSGPGHLQVALTNKGILAHGLDESWQMVKQAKKRLSQGSFPSNVIHGRAQSMPYASGKFDQVVATFPSEYIADPNTLGQVWRVLKDGGELIIIPVAWITGKKWWDRLAAGLFRFTGQAPEYPKSGNHLEFLPVEFIAQFGFTITTEIIQLPTSQVLLIKAIKPGLIRN